MATRRSRLQIRPNLGPRVGTKPPQADNEKAKEKSQETIKSPVRSLSNITKNLTKDPEPNENQKPDKNVVEVQTTHNEVKCKDKINTEVEEAIGSPKGQKPQYTALRAKIKAKPNLSLAGKPRRTTEDPQPKCPSSPLKSPRPSIHTPSLKSPPPRPNYPSCPSPVKHVPNVPRTDITKSTEDKEERTEKPKQTRKHTKVDIPKDAPLDKTSMKMSDLIFWNPNRNFMSTQNKPEKSTKTANKKDEEEPIVNPLLQATEEEARVDEGEEEREEGEVEGEEEAMPVPQVKIGPDGSLIINEESLVVNTKKPVVEEDTDAIDETENTTTYASFRKPQTRQIWSKQETEKFYYALSSIGTDFTLMLKVFPNKTRADLKKKFVKEDRENRLKIEKAFRERKPFDMEVFKQLDELVEKEKQDKQKEKQKARKSHGKNVESVDDKSSTSSTTTVRRSKRKTAGSGKYFDYSNDAMEDDEEDFVKEKPTPAKHPKWNSKKTGQGAKGGNTVAGQYSALNESEIAQAIGNANEVNSGQGPLILVYNKPEDPAGETVIHVYRLQPQFSHLVENSNGQPIIVDGNDFQLMEDSGQKSQSIMTLQGKTSESALRGVSELPPQFLASDTDQVTEVDISEDGAPGEPQPQVFIPQNVMTLANEVSQCPSQEQEISLSEEFSEVHQDSSDEKFVSEQVDEEQVPVQLEAEVNFQPVTVKELMETGSWNNGAVNTGKVVEQKVCVEQISTYIDVNIIKEDT